MRQIVLVVVLVAASFLGGAFVNGPGLRWVQTQLLGSLGLSEGGEIASVELPGAIGLDASVDGTRPAKSSPEANRGPRAPVPTLVSEDEAGKADAPDRRPSRPAGSADADPSASPPPTAPPPSASPPSPSPPPSTAPLASPGAAASLDPGESPSRATSPASARAPAPRDPSVTPAVATSLPGSAGDPAPSGRGVIPAVLESLASLMPSGPPPPAEARPDPAPAPAGGEDWAALDRKMRALGVSRFTIEGQPGGRAVFSCLIPLAGRQAVAQRFEAEGDDGFRAAQAALHRIALWRATQPSP